MSTWISSVSGMADTWNPPCGPESACGPTPDTRPSRRVLVTGAAGFIGTHLVKALVANGYWVRGVDIRQPEFEPSAAHEFEILDLRSDSNCQRACDGIDEVYHLAADMGGIGYIGTKRAHIAAGNSRIDAQMLEAAVRGGAKRFFFSSSACVYPMWRQETELGLRLREFDAIPAQPEPGYGWAKLFTEQLCHYYREEFGLTTRVARFHNIFGQLGCFRGGREKSVAALCRKIAMAEDGGTIDIWGGDQIRSYLYIDDCIRGVLALMHSNFPGPVNLGSEEAISVTELAFKIAKIAGKRIVLKACTGPRGVGIRSSDSHLAKEVLGWEPFWTLEHGLRETHGWIHGQLVKEGLAR